MGLGETPSNIFQAVAPLNKLLIIKFVASLIYKALVEKSMAVDSSCSLSEREAAIKLTIGSDTSKFILGP